MNTQRNDGVEIDILHLLKTIWQKKIIIVFVALIFGVIALLVSMFLIKPSYTAKTRLYVVNQAQTGTNNLTAQDLQAGSYLVNDYKEIITSNEVLAEVIKKEKLPLSERKLQKMISVSIPTDTRVISISVKSHSAHQAQLIANKTREVASDKIKDVTKVKDVTTLEAAQLPKGPSSPNTRRNILLGLVFGVVVAVVGVLLIEILDDHVRRPEDIEEALGMPLLGMVPDFDKL